MGIKLFNHHDDYTRKLHLKEFTKQLEDNVKARPSYYVRELFTKYSALNPSPCSCSCLYVIFDEIYPTIGAG